MPNRIRFPFSALGKLDKALGCPLGANRFSNSFDNPQVLASEGGFDSVLFGIERQNGHKADDTFSIEVRQQADTLFSLPHLTVVILTCSFLFRSMRAGRLPPFPIFIVNTDILTSKFHHSKSARCSPFPAAVSSL